MAGPNSYAKVLSLCSAYSLAVNSARRQPGLALTAVWLRRGLSPKAARLLGTTHCQPHNATPTLQQCTCTFATPTTLLDYLSGSLHIHIHLATPGGEGRGGGIAWHGMVWYGMAWCGMVWYGMVWYDMVWYGMAWHGMRWHGMS
jgi:hypothetical protein